MLRTSQFAIRPTIRNHNTLTRSGVIKQIASAVGHGHEVDLTNYNLLIVVEIYKVRALNESATGSANRVTEHLRHECVGQQL